MWLALALPTLAQDGSEFHVVLRFEPHRLMTSAFRQEVRQQLSAGLASALSGICRVRLFEFDEQRPEDRLPAWVQAFDGELKNLEQVDRPGRWKTHYVTIGYQNGQYRVRSRQSDGILGWCSPVVRDDTTVDRAFVGRLALDQVISDFGFTGQLSASDSDRTATCTIDAGNNMPDAALRSWVRLSDVFAVIRGGKSGRGYIVPHTFLVVTKEPTNGSIECRIESRYVKSLAGWESGTFRIVHLGAGRGPIRLRAISTTGNVLPELNVRLSSTGFEKNDAVREQMSMRHGRLASLENYDRIGFARILAGERLLAQVPVTILGNEPTIIEVNLEPTGDAVVAADSDLRQVHNRLRDLLSKMDEDNDQLKRLLFDRKNRQALGLLITTLRRFDDELPALAAEVATLQTNTSKANAGALSELQRCIRDLKAHGDSLKKTKADLEESLGAGSDERLTGIRAMLAKAVRDERDADYDTAIATYEQILKQSGDWPEVARRLTALKKDWEPKSDAHRAARKFIYETWAKAKSIDEVEKALAGARQAFATCKQADDKLAPRKLYLGLVQAAGLAVRRDEELRRSDAEEAAKQMESLRNLSTALRNFLNEVEAYLKMNS